MSGYVLCEVESPSMVGALKVTGTLARRKHSRLQQWLPPPLRLAAVLFTTCALTRYIAPKMYMLVHF